MYLIAVAGTVAVIGANVVLRPLGRRRDRDPASDEEISVDYRFEAICADSAEAHIRALIVHAVTGTSTFALRGIRGHNTTDTGTQRVSVVAALSARQSNDCQLEQAVCRLSLEPSVIAVSWTVRTTPIPAQGQFDNDHSLIRFRDEDAG